MLKKQLLASSKVIAVVGHSDKPSRESYRIGKYLRQYYTVYAVNPAVKEIEAGVKSYATLRDIPEHVDIVNVFRRSEYLPSVVEEAVEIGAGSVWAQLGVKNEEAKELAEGADMPIVMDTCIFVEHEKL